MKDYKFQHGELLIDIITGFEGIVTGRADYITGCNQYSLQPKVKKDDKDYRIGHWFDEDRLKPEKNRKKIKITVGSNPGGPKSNPAPMK